MECDRQTITFIIIRGTSAAAEPVACKRTVCLCYENSDDTAAICRWTTEDSSAIQNKRRTVTLLLSRSLYVTHLLLFPRAFIFCFLFS
jgi:hypothetical protein